MPRYAKPPPASADANRREPTAPNAEPFSEASVDRSSLDGPHPVTQILSHLKEADKVLSKDGGENLSSRAVWLAPLLQTLALLKPGDRVRFELNGGGADSGVGIFLGFCNYKRPLSAIVDTGADIVALKIRPDDYRHGGPINKHDRRTGWADIQMVVSRVSNTIQIQGLNPNDLSWFTKLEIEKLTRD